MGNTYSTTKMNISIEIHPKQDTNFTQIQLAKWKIYAHVSAYKAKHTNSNVVVNEEEKEEEQTDHKNVKIHIFYIEEYADKCDNVDLLRCVAKMLLVTGFTREFGVPKELRALLFKSVFQDAKYDIWMALNKLYAQYEQMEQRTDSLHAFIVCGRRGGDTNMENRILQVISRCSP
eukprot:851214_1